jgi:mono/diheme cytochrome c family protein
MVRNLLILLLIFAFAGCGGKKKTDSIHIEDPAKGEALFTRVGCATCHSISGEKKYGPSLNSIFDKKVAVIRNGTTDTVRVDRQYILRSLKDPGFEKVASFQKRKMPPLNLSQEEIDYLVDYIIFINKNNQ